MKKPDLVFITKENEERVREKLQVVAPALPGMALPPIPAQTEDTEFGSYEEPKEEAANEEAQYPSS